VVGPGVRAPLRRAHHEAAINRFRDW
jgi:hypothetical protein